MYPSYNKREVLISVAEKKGDNATEVKTSSGNDIDPFRENFEHAKAKRNGLTTQEGPMFTD